MNILLLGNGFDIANYLPTRYNNFLHVVNYIINNDYSTFITLGDIMSSEKLHIDDPFIKDCYNKHHSIYDHTYCIPQDFDNIKQSAENNYWFKYLTKSFDKDIGWIDFEREIAVVIHCFESLFEEIEPIFRELEGKVIYKNDLVHYVINEFNFFYNKKETFITSHGTMVPTTYVIKEEYIFEYPKGSNIRRVNIDEIINFLYKQLLGLSGILKWYLATFSDSVSSLCKNNTYNIFGHTDCAISLNYTHTFEKIYPDTNIFHIHGDIGGNIVLGINPDGSDLKESSNIAFLAFKKYFQRTQYDTDVDYLRWVDENYSNVHDRPFITHLLVMGHSLDITDKDIICQLFEVASEITVLYHNNKAKSDYIQHLVRIFGKEKFDQIRNEQHLSFMPLNADFAAFSKKRQHTSERLLKFNDVEECNFEYDSPYHFDDEI